MAFLVLAITSFAIAVITRRVETLIEALRGFAWPPAENKVQPNGDS